LIGFITRAFSHTGPRRGKNFSISSDAYQIARIMRGKQDRVLEVGNLESVRVVIDVRDCVRAYYLLMMNDNSSGHVYNVCGSVPMKMGFFTDEMIKMSGLDIKKVVSEKYYRPIDIHCQIGSVEKLNLLTGWEPNIPIEKTLSDLLYYWLKKIS
jgi:GDPmannose 4,6-dehydratase